jgi:hypothetical protein
MTILLTRDYEDNKFRCACGKETMNRKAMRDHARLVCKHYIVSVSDASGDEGSIGTVEPSLLPNSDSDGDKDTDTNVGVTEGGEGDTGHRSEEESVEVSSISEEISKCGGITVNSVDDLVLVVCHVCNKIMKVSYNTATLSVLTEANTMFVFT